MTPRALLAAAAFLAASSHAFADESPADRLYREGLALYNEGKMTEACTKFEESRRAENGIGVTLYLGACYKKLGKTATAWGRYREAEELARARHDPRESVARAEVAELEPTLSRIEVHAASPDGVEVSVDGVRLPEAQWSGTPVDPGAHLVRSRARGRAPREQRVDVPTGPATLRVDVEVSPSPPVGVAPAPRDPARTQRTIALAVGGAGVVAAGGGAIFGLVAIHKVDSSNEGSHCVDDRCDAVGARLRDDARTPAALSTAFFIAGAAALAAGVILYLTAPRASTPATAGFAF